jgi:hypothetical protein
MARDKKFSVLNTHVTKHYGKTVRAPKFHLLPPKITQKLHQNFFGFFYKIVVVVVVVVVVEIAVNEISH